MLNRLILLALFNVIVILSYAQEKRIALVIGNANYSSEAILQNPINDVLLMESTLKNLGFDVIVETDIETRGEFVEVIEKYNDARKRYNVGIVYYAGHAVQINGVNYMLATKEKYESESNIKYNGLDISIFTSEWENVYNNELNILVLDACRNNPFEKKIYGEARDIKSNGLGLAEINRSSQPAGSLVAFSTAAGKTAADAFDGSKNSLYCMSLCKNLQLEDVSIRNIFGKVSREIYMQTGQYPELSDKMFDVDFYLKKSTFQDEILMIDSLYEQNNTDLALEKTNSILVKQPTNLKALLLKGKILFNEKPERYNGEDLFYADKLYPNNLEVQQYLARFYSSKSDFNSALIFIEKAIILDSNNSENYYWKARFYHELQDYEICETTILKAIELDENNYKYYELTGLNLLVKGDLERAEIAYKKTLELDTSYLMSYLVLGGIYNEQGKFNKARNTLKIGFEKTTSKDPLYYDFNVQIAHSYFLEKDYCIALDYLETVTSEIETNVDAYFEMGNIYTEMQDYIIAIDFFEKALNISKESDYYLNRGLCYFNLSMDDLALRDFYAALKIDSLNIRAINNIALIFSKNQSEFEKSSDFLVEKIRSYTGADKEGLALCYSNLAYCYVNLSDFKTAFACVDSAIKLNPLRFENYYSKIVLLQEQNELVNAEQLIQNTIKLFPHKKIELLNELAFIESNFNVKKAVRIYDEILEIDSMNAEANYKLGEIYLYDFLDFNKAITYFSIVISGGNDEYLLDAFLRRSEAFTEKGLIDNAKRDLEIVIDKFETNAKACYNLATILQEENKYFDAIELLNQGIRKNPNNTDLYWILGTLYEDIEQNNMARVQYNNCISIDSTYFDAYYTIGDLLLFEDKDYQNAIKYYSKGIEFDSTGIESVSYGYWGLTDALIRVGELKKAEELYLKWKELNPTDVDLYSLLGDFYFYYKKDVPLALDYYNKAIKIDENNLWALGSILGIYIELKEVDKATKIQKKIIDLDTANYNYHQLRYANLLIDLGENTSRIKGFENLIAKIDTSLYIEYGKYFYKQKLFAEAINYFKLALETENNPAQSYYYLAKSHLAVGDTILAQNYYSYLGGILSVQDDIDYFDFSFYSYGTEIEIFDIRSELAEFYLSVNLPVLACEEYTQVFKELESNFTFKANNYKKEIPKKLFYSCK
jgi:tetratricopeptide (TPR) repeat protein